MNRSVGRWAQSGLAGARKAIGNQHDFGRNVLKGLGRAPVYNGRSDGADQGADQGAGPELCATAHRD